MPQNISFEAYFYAFLMSTMFWQVANTSQPEVGGGEPCGATPVWHFIHKSGNTIANLTVIYATDA